MYLSEPELAKLLNKAWDRLNYNREWTCKSNKLTYKVLEVALDHGVARVVYERNNIRFDKLLDEFLEKFHE